MLEVTGLCITYPGQPALLQDISFSLASGQALWLQGPNGSGKTSLLYSLANVIPQMIDAARQGTITLEGRLMNEVPVNQMLPDISLSLDNPRREFLFTTPAEEIIYVLENLGLPETEIEGRLKSTLAAFQLEPWQDTPTHQLSFGWQKLVSLSVQAAANPRVLLLDEPFNSLSEQASGLAIIWLKSFLAQGGILLLADHTGICTALDPQILILPAGAH